MSINQFTAIDKKIRSTEEELERIKNTLDPSSVEYHFLTSILNERLNELKKHKQELQDTIQSEKLTLVISGKGVEKGSISARVLAAVLNGLQSIADSIANALGNEPTEKGKIPSDILRQSDLIVVNTFPGSFGIELEGKIEYSNLFDDPLLTQTLSRLFGLLSSGTDADKIMESIADLGPRTLSHYKQWIKTMAEQEVSVHCEWKSRYAERYFWSIDTSTLPTLLETLDTIREEDSTEIELSGSLTGMNIRKETFEFMDDEGNIITGRSKNELLRNHRDLIGEKSRFKFIKTTTRNVSTGKEKISWFLFEVIRN